MAILQTTIFGSFTWLPKANEMASLTNPVSPSHDLKTTPPPQSVVVPHLLFFIFGPVRRFSSAYLVPGYCNIFVL